jgi:3-hydroxyisobutyrate dehydrogenase-like beta-hydroxyacid dehydrogenase
MKLLTADNVKLGFVGLGNMGSRIAQRLLDHGYPLVAYDRDIAKAEAVAAERGFVARNILELARTADVILSCLTNDEAVQSVYAGPTGIFAEARRGAIVLEMSTISQKVRVNCTGSALRVASKYWMSPSRAALLPPNRAS